MNNKKNAGFSLVELIVVIAIMAVLVGVLAPAYLKYVEKSRKSTDISAVADMITASSTVAADVEYDVQSGSEFEIKVNGKALELECHAGSDDETDYDKATAGWKDVANCEKNYKLKSKDFQKKATDNSDDSITGVVQDSGAVTWASPSGGLFGAMVSYSKDLSSKFSAAE